MTFKAEQWECRGFDGEGCEHTVSFADTARPLGRVESTTGFDWRPGQLAGQAKAPGPETRPGAFA